MTILGASIRKTVIEMLAAREVSQQQAEMLIRGIERNVRDWSTFNGDRVMDAVFPPDEAEERRAEAAWEEQQQRETGADRCPPRE